MDYFYNYLNSFTPISKDTFETFSKILTIEQYNKKAIFCAIGESPKFVFFLKTGIVRAYIKTAKGEEFNREIFVENEILSSLSSLILNKESIIGLQCLTDCVMYKADFKAFMELTKTNYELLKLYQLSLEANFIKLEKRTIELSTMTATERYIKLRKRIPNIDNLISQYHIASHLGITPIQQSRIRKKISLSN
jgi:CRP-like cAMP-binding protein